MFGSILKCTNNFFSRSGTNVPNHCPSGMNIPDDRFNINANPQQLRFITLTSIGGILLKLSLYSIILILFIISAIQAEALVQSVTTDQARYAPEESVQFEINLNETVSDANLQVSYFHLNEKLEEQTVSVYAPETSWTWQPPSMDFKGYMAEIILLKNEAALDTTWIAVDVSSDWGKFPRYGFLSKYPYLSETQIQRTISTLNRYHINAFQFYDWHYKHHLPLKGTPENPASFWNDIANRTNYFSTVSGYIKAAHQRNMKAMAYNLLYGAYQDAAADGVPEHWRLFRDPNHSQPDLHDLPDSWASDIYLIDPSNPQWVNYIIDRTRDAFAALDFDGWHIDQLGDRGKRYNYTGQEVILSETFAPFIQSVKSSLNTTLVMNAVNQYGQQAIAKSPVDILYTEVWSPNDTYSSLASIIQRNNMWSDGKLQTVLAAYVNKGKSSQPGTFNTPSVLMANAVIFAAGGAHLELGEHLLANEYFPNDNLQMSDELEEQLVAYYDFLVAYQNILRDGGQFNQVQLQSEGDLAIRTIARKGSVWSFAKEFEGRQLFHLINFVNAETLDWRDDAGEQPEPQVLRNVPVSFQTERTVKSLWMASPDRNGGAPMFLEFEQQANQVRFTIPSLRYWDMVVADYESSSSIGEPKTVSPKSFIVHGNYPNPFNPSTLLRFRTLQPINIKIDIYNAVGEVVNTLANHQFPAGEHAVSWKPAATVPGGVYFAVLREGNMALSKLKLVYIK